LIFNIPSPPPNKVGNFLSVLPNICFSSIVRCFNSSTNGSTSGGSADFF
jgi:hypothetical protein